jgi:hypothetical protein
MGTYFKKTLRNVIIMISSPDGSGIPSCNAEEERRKIATGIQRTAGGAREELGFCAPKTINNSHHSFFYICID